MLFLRNNLVSLFFWGGTVKEASNTRLKCDAYWYILRGQQSETLVKTQVNIHKLGWIMVKTTAK